LSPAKRQQNILIGRQHLFSEPNRSPLQSDIIVDQNMVIVPARVLEPPRILIEPHLTAKPHLGAWRVDNQKFIQPSSLQFAHYIVVGELDPALIAQIQWYHQALANTLSNLGLAVGDRSPGIYFAERGDIERVFKEVVDNSVQSFGRQPQLVFCILPTSAASLYAQIKRIGDIFVGIPTQCILRKSKS
jgi:eukaryotic translation initiation factor 2C